MERADRQSRWLMVVGGELGPRARVEDRLRAAGYEVSGFATVEDTLVQLRTGPAPDLVLLDVPSPIEDAFRRAHKADPALAPIKVLALFTVDAARLIDTIDELFAGPPRLDLSDPLAFLTANLIKMGEQLPALLASSRRFAALTGPASVAAIGPLLESARRGGERIESYVPYLNAFGPTDDSARGPTDVGRVLDFVIDIAKHEIRERAQLVKRFDKTPLVFAGEKPLGQVFSSLIINAAESIPFGRSDENRIHVSTSTDDRGQCAIEIADTGSGIAPDVLPHVFEPFYSTKRGAGMGLGLFICHTTITGLGGTITVQSTVGEGTRFRVTLPPMGNIAAPG